MGLRFGWRVYACASKAEAGQACADFPEFVPVCRRLLLQVSFGNALAREIIAEPNWDALQKILAATSVITKKRKKSGPGKR
jgi:hypothetical protein